MAIDGDYLNSVKSEFDLSQERLATILCCSKFEVITYLAHRKTPIPTQHAELLVAFVQSERRLRSHDARQILEELVHEMRSEGHSFSPNKILAHTDKVGEIVRDRKNFGLNVTPFLLELHLTNCCNHNCPGCTFADIHGDPKQRSKKQDTGRIYSLLDELREFGVRAIFWSGGGEPLMHPDAESIFRHAAKKGFQQILITNGALLHRIDLTFLVECFSCVRISIDAQTDSSYMKTHGFTREAATNEINKVHSNVRSLVAVYNRTPESKRNRDMNVIGIGVSFLLQETNEDDLVGFCTSARDSLGVRFAEIKPLVHPRNEENDATIRRLVNREFADMLRLLKRRIARPPSFKVFTLEHKFLDMMSESYGKTYVKCWAHSLYPAISADGGVYPCCLMIGKSDLCFGNVYRHSFKDIWTSKKRRRAVERIDVPMCPINCKLSESNKSLETVMRSLDLPLPDYIN